MTEQTDVVVIGAGPAGMAAAVAAAEAGASVVTLDDQPAPGGQIWRAVEAVAARGDIGLFGGDYGKGLAAVQRFRAAGVDYRPLCRVVGVEDAEDDGDGVEDPGGDVLYLRDGAARRLNGRRVIIATGAYERPTPFPGWTLPGVMSLGAAQIALKTGDLAPQAPFVLAGQGPLLLLLAAQLRAAGSSPALILRTDDPASRRKAVGHGARALVFGPDYLAKGLRWTVGLGPAVHDVTALKAEGDERLEAVSWETARGEIGRIDAACLLVHDGVLPNAQLTRSMRARHVYDSGAAAWRPAASLGTGLLDSHEWAHVAGDCAGVAGWAGAMAAGALAGQAAARALGKAAPGGWSGWPTHARLARARAVRPFLDAVFPPARAFLSPGDDVLVCRCEEASAGDIRAAAALGAQGTNQLKAFARVGMGPCQGRMCASSAARLLADAKQASPAHVPLMRTRMPISPVTLSEMAQLNQGEDSAPLF